MKKIDTKANFDDPDGFYSELVDLYGGRSPDEVGLINARLILLLSNHIGDIDIVREAFAIATSQLDIEAFTPHAPTP